VEFKVRKTKKNALIALHPDFADWLARRPVPKDLWMRIFASLALERSSSKHTVSEQFKKIMAKAGIAGREVVSEAGDIDADISFSAYLSRRTGDGTASPVAGFGEKRLMDWTYLKYLKFP
jgi:hypothetical protein